MREECKHFESRTYRSGETVRRCGLGLAPEAPWRCPEECGSYEPRLADVNWTHGTLVRPPTPPEPSGVGEDPAVAEVLDRARDIVNSVAPEVRSEVDELGDAAGGDDAGRGGLFGWFRRRRSG